jgi:hypothetical protein
MKKIFTLFSICLCFRSVTEAQISKGSIWLGGNLGFSSSKNEDQDHSNSNSYSVYPAIGLALRNNNVVGLELNFNRYHRVSSSDTVTTTGKGLGLFDRQYWTMFKRFYVFADFEGNYTATTEDYNYSNSSQHSTGKLVELSASPGISFSVTKWFFLESAFNDLFYFNYSKKNKTQTDPSGKASYESHSVSGGVNFGNQSAFVVGVRFIVNKD